MLLLALCDITVGVFYSGCGDTQQGKDQLFSRFSKQLPVRPGTRAQPAQDENVRCHEREGSENR